MVKTENRSQWISAAEKQDGYGEKSNFHHEFPLGGDGRYYGDRRISGRRRFLPQPHPSPNRVHPPTPNPPLYTVNFVVTVIKSAPRISGRRRFLPWPCPSPHHLCPPNPPPPPYTVVFVVVIVIGRTRRILVWWLSLPQPHHRINWVRPHTPPPPPYTVKLVVVVMKK